MPQQIVIAEQLRIAAVLTDDRVDELIVAQGRYQIGDVYLGTVENVLPESMQPSSTWERRKTVLFMSQDLGPLYKKGSAGITELLEPRQKVLVQVMKEPTAPKVLGSQAISLCQGVIWCFGPWPGCEYSRRISAESERTV